VINRQVLVLGPLAVVAAAALLFAAVNTGSTVETAGPDAVAVTPPVAADPTAPVTDSVASAQTALEAAVLAAATSTSTTSTTTTAVPLAPADGKESSERRLVESFVVQDENLQPKSIVASGDGLFFAQNMMYRHNVAIYDRAGNQVATISDGVDLGSFGIDGGAQAQGSPVEAAFTPDGRFVYVSNYKIFGEGFNPVADDECNRGNWDDSFVYKIDVQTFEIVAVVPTGAVPKFLAVTPDGSKLVVSNWCGFDVSIIDTATDTEVRRIDVGRHPRGVAIRSDSQVAYVTVMGEHRIDVIDLNSYNVVNAVPDPGTTPRHILLSDDDRYLYVSNHKMNSVRKIDLQQGQVTGVASTGEQTRTMALADDGESLYVVNYVDGTVSKVRTDDMEILQTVYSGFHPVGIAYDEQTRQVWVANYAGSLTVFVDE
jgi:YVTN family beta-propeller protein